MSDRPHVTGNELHKYYCTITPLLLQIQLYFTCHQKEIFTESLPGGGGGGAGQDHVQPLYC